MAEYAFEAQRYEKLRAEQNKFIYFLCRDGVTSAKLSVGVLVRPEPKIRQNVAVVAVLQLLQFKTKQYESQKIYLYLYIYKYIYKYRSIFREDKGFSRTATTATLQQRVYEGHCLSLYSVDSLRALICYCFVNYCLLY